MALDDLDGDDDEKVSPGKLLADGDPPEPEVQESPEPDDSSKDKPARTKRRRSTKAELAVRVTAVANLLLNGYDRTGVQRFVARERKSWGVGPDQVDNYISQAGTMIDAVGVVDVEREKRKAHRRFEMLYQTAIAGGLVSTALRIQRAINRLHNLEPPTVTRIGGDKESPLMMPGVAVQVVFAQVPESPHMLTAGDE